MQYCETIYETRRFPTREVRIGQIGIGKDHPIRIQSMTTTDTRNVEATVEQICRLADAGCEMVRITVQGKKEAESVEKIRNALFQKGCTLPLIADIHFYPPAAFFVVEFVDKIRINPGNFLDKRATLNKVLEYDEASYSKELLKLEEGFAPFVEKCKRLQKAMRIGVNHGSLSDRILNRYGDTIQGMVESAFEFANICRKCNYHEFCFSMKASNPLIMIRAYRLLVAEMKQRGWDYPLHLGVTEAGEGEDGRLKSSIGIGSLLLDGIGDTIRVSLTEDPWQEIDPARRLIKWASRRQNVGIAPFEETFRNPLESVSREIDSHFPFDQKGAVVVKKKEGYFLQNAPLDLSRCIILKPQISLLHEARKQVEELHKTNDRRPLIAEMAAPADPADLPILAGAEYGALLADRLIEGIVVEEERFGLNLLQAVRLRMTKTDFISCPGCGRTLFDLQETSRRIRQKTAHLPGVKIAIMGCIVNGPGEMADADFGYVGSRPGKIDLYVGKNCVERNVDFLEADEKLIALLKSYGKWIEPYDIISSCI